ncbi:nitronate monooxygenase [Arthrobacter oryzae]|nr:nitronate monooxygenase [Arthrobacter oryzae]
MSNSKENFTHGADMPLPGARLHARGLLQALGAEIPLVAAPMAGGPSTPQLVVAAARAGGLGFLAGGYKTAGQLAEQISEVRRLTSRFGVNLFVPNAVPVERAAFIAYCGLLGELAAKYGVDLGNAEPAEDDDNWDTKIAVLVGDPVPVVSFTFGLPTRDVVHRLQEAGSLVMQTVTNAAEARQAVSVGVDGLIVQGSLAGGHSGTFTPDAPIRDTPLVQLLADVRAQTELPIWAAGGLSTPRAVREALAAGAEAAVVGTVLLRSEESGASATYKAALADPARTGTVMTTAFSGRPARALRNEFVERFHAVAPLGYPALHHLTSPIRKAAAAAGDQENINIWAGAGYRDASNESASVILRRLGGR